MSKNGYKQEKFMQKLVLIIFSVRKAMIKPKDTANNPIR